MAHYLLSKTTDVLLKASPNDEALLKESLRIEKCSMNLDKDFEGAEIIEPIFRKRRSFFETGLKQFPADYRNTLHKAFEVLDRERKSGNG